MEMPTLEAPYRLHRYPTGLIDRVKLRDGRSVTVRPVLPQDAGLAQHFVRGLDARSRYRRFQMGARSLPDALAQYLTHIDYRQHLALIAEAAGPAPVRPGVTEPPSPERSSDEFWSSERSSGEPGAALVQVADARWVRRDDGVSADFAIVVDDAWQGLGLGGYLLAALGRAARAHGIERLDGDVLADNGPMLALARSLGCSVGPHPEDARLVRVSKALAMPQRRATPDSAP
jgi:acetyltransferase